jgi:hypothetical protein
MSLEKKPPSLPPERMPQPSLSEIDVSPLLEGTYWERCVQYAQRKTREHEKVELRVAAAITVAAAVTGGTWAGISAGIASGVAMLFIMVVGIFLYHLICSPKGIDDERREQIIKAIRERDALKAQLEERDKYKLVPVIDVNHSSQVFLDHYPEHESSPPELDAPLDHYSGRVNLRIWFENSDVKKGFMRGVKLSLVKMDHAGEAKEIHLFRPAMSITDEATASEVKWNQGLVVETTTPVYWITWTFDVVGADFDAVSNDGKRFDRDCFIQFTLDAMDQPLKTDDFDVDWEEAERTGTYNITPRT